MKFLNYFLRGKTPILRLGQAYFYQPHLILTFAHKPQGGAGPPPWDTNGGGKKTNAPPCVRLCSIVYPLYKILHYRTRFCFSISFCTIFCTIVQDYALVYPIVQDFALLYKIMLYYILLYKILLYCTRLCSSISYCTRFCTIVQDYALVYPIV